MGYAGKEKSTQFGRKSQRLAIPLEPGFVFTVEPGVYFIPELIDLWQKERRFEEFINYGVVDTYRDFGGIRNEEGLAHHRRWSPSPRQAHTSDAR